MSAPRRRGFTLVEIIVSIAIFAIIGALMLGALFGATEVFRRGEAARQSGDEATAVIAALRHDLARAVPVLWRDGAPANEGGWFRAAVGLRPDGSARRDGSTLLACVIENPDRAAIVATEDAATGQQRVTHRRIVAWFVRPDPEAPDDPVRDQLCRAEFDWRPNGGDRDDARKAEQIFSGAAGAPAAPAGATMQVVASGCLHFGVWFELSALHRRLAPGDGGPVPDWEDLAAAQTDPPVTAVPQPPARGNPYDSAGQPGTLYSPDQSIRYWPPADAMRVTLVLTGGGRYALRGHVANHDGGRIRIVGLSTLPTLAGSLLRIGDEWVGYDDFRSGLLTGVRRAQLRSAGQGSINPRTPVYAGQFFSLVAPLPR